jgi:hypothetical protein
MAKPVEKSDAEIELRAREAALLGRLPLLEVGDTAVVVEEFTTEVMLRPPHGNGRFKTTVVKGSPALIVSSNPSALGVYYDIKVGLDPENISGGGSHLIVDVMGVPEKALQRSAEPFKGLLVPSGGSTRKGGTGDRLVALDREVRRLRNALSEVMESLAAVHDDIESSLEADVNELEEEDSSVSPIGIYRGSR